MSTVLLDYVPAAGGTRLASVVDGAGKPISAYSDAGRTTVVTLPYVLPVGGATLYLATGGPGPWCATLTAVADGRVLGTATGSADSFPVTLVLRDPPNDNAIMGDIDGGTP